MTFLEVAQIGEGAILFDCLAELVRDRRLLGAINAGPIDMIGLGRVGVKEGCGNDECVTVLCEA